MAEVAPRIDPLRAELPEFSVDWRFLLPVSPRNRILILSSTWHDFSLHFAGLGMEVVSCHVAEASPRKAQERLQADEQHGWQLLARPTQMPFKAASFDAAVIPLGLPGALLRSSYGEDPLGGLKRLLRPGGVLLLGFSNRWSILQRGRQMGIGIAPGSIRRRLEGAGFGRFSLYGAVPNLEKPAYILPLTKRPLQFFLRHRFLGRRRSGLLSILPAPLISQIVPGLLPGYFLLAGE